MTIIVVLVGLLISHFLTGAGQWRNFDWMLWPVRELRGRFPDQPWIALVTVVLTTVLVAALASWIMVGLFGTPGWLMLALVVFVYTLGPRDLNGDIAQMLDQPDHADAREAAQSLGLEEDSSPGEAVAATLHAARSRWFSILFWFVVLGIPGALLYRLGEKALSMTDLSADEADWLGRLRWVMEWPVHALMLVSAGLGADLDRVHQAWTRYHQSRPWWLLSPPVLDEVAADLADAQTTLVDGLRLGRQLVWRMLVLWLVVLSLMLLAGWLA